MINVLPGNLANLIAAGEVVGRPASVLKELMENSIDAGADNISVYVEDAGRTVIKVIDNGSGMDTEDAKICFERHATSKISSPEDLEKIMSYGFRGEALASIAAVSRVVLKTRREQDEVGVEVHCTQSQIQLCQQVSTPKGCIIEVRDLFYNTPARRKFLKTEAAELRHIVQEFGRVALTRPQIAFSLTHNNKQLYNLRPVQMFVQRIADFCGISLVKELAAVSTDTSLVNVSGFVGNPTDARKTLGNQYLFVNGRYFRSPYIHKAICRPYEDLLKEGQTPSYFLFLDADPSRIDVNIHPAKTEVKFEDEQMIFEIVTAAVRQTLARNAFTPSIDFETAPTIDFPAISKEAPHFVVPPKIDFDPLFNPFDFDGPHAQVQQQPLPSSNSMDLFVQGKYIIAQSDHGLMIVSVQKARERVFYDSFFPNLAEKEPVVEQTLYPMTISLSPENHFLAIENIDVFGRFGFDLRDLGQNDVVLYGLPSGMSCERKGVEDALLELLSALRRGLIGETIAQDTATLAHSAAMSMQNMPTKAEAQLLVKELMDCRQCAEAPTGGKTFTIITNEEIDKLI